MLFTELPFVERFGAARRAGFDAVEFWFPYGHDIDELRMLIDDNGLELVVINSPPGDIGAGEWGLAALGDVARFDSSMREAIEAADRLGARHLHVMAGIEVEAGGWNRYVLSMGRALALSVDHDVRLVIEPLNPRDRPGYVLNRCEQASELIAALGPGRIGLMFDVYHVQIAQGDLFERLARHMPQIAHVQIASVPSRSEPDDGEVAYGALLGRLDALGYRGRVGLEYRPRGSTLAGLSWMDSLGPR